MKTLAAFATIVMAAALAVAAEASPPAHAAVPLTAITQKATAITDSTATLNGVTGPAGKTVTYYFEYGLTSDYGTQTAALALTVPPDVPAVAANVDGLLPATVYHFRIVTTLDGVTAPGTDQTFTTGAPGQLGSAGQYSGNGGASGDDHSLGTTSGDDHVAPPVLGQTVGVGPAKGTIRIKRPGDDGYMQLVGDAPVPSGSIIDARNGTVNLVTALPDGTTQAAKFRGAAFKVRQADKGKGMTDLYLRGGSFRGCSSVAPGRARVVTAARKHKRSIRRLWGSDHHGRFRTHGRHAVATVRGTVWSVTDRCDGTLTSVAKGKVAVRDKVRHKTVLVKAGHRYLARAKR